MITAKTPTAIRRKPAVTAATPHGPRQPCRISHDTIGSRPSAKTSARTTALPAVKAAPKIRRVGHLGSARTVTGGGTSTGAAPVDPVAPGRSFAALAGGCGSLGSEVDTPTPPVDHPRMRSGRTPRPRGAPTGSSPSIRSVPAGRPSAAGGAHAHVGVGALPRAARAVAGDGGQLQLRPALQVGPRVPGDGVDLPRLATRTGHPDLVLDRVAARGVVLDPDGQAGVGHPGRGGGDVTGRGHLDAQVVHAGRLAGLPLQQHQLQRGLRDREVGVPGTALGGRNVEEARVEVDSGVEVGYAQSELHTGHGIHLSLETSTDVDVWGAWQL